MLNENRVINVHCVAQKRGELNLKCSLEVTAKKLMEHHTSHLFWEDDAWVDLCPVNSSRRTSQVFQYSSISSELS